MQLARAIVVLAATLPHPKIWSPVGTLNIKHKILNEVHFVRRVYNLQNGLILNQRAVFFIHDSNSN